MNSNLPRQEVVVTDVRMPFGSMVKFMVKWAIASIPAMVILLVLGALFWTVLATLPKISTPKIAESHIPANEASAIASIKAISTGEMIYSSGHPDVGFTANLVALSGSAHSEQFIDKNLASGRKGGYTFTYTPGDKINRAIRSYTITAVPDEVGTSGQRRFFADESGEIHYNADGPADLTSPVIQ